MSDEEPNGLRQRLDVDLPTFGSNSEDVLTFSFAGKQNGGEGTYFSASSEAETSRGHFGLGEPRCNITSHGSADDYQLNRTRGRTNARKTRMLFARG